MPARRLAVAFLAAIAAGQLWLVSAVPIMGAAGASHDDALFARLAVSLLSGDWLGPYDNLILAKGPFYSMWIAAVAWLGTPLFLSQAVFAILNAIAKGYKSAGPPAAALAALAFALALMQAAWTRRADALLFINGMLLIAVASRLGLLAYMDVTALPAVNSLYMSPAAAPGNLFVVLAPVAAARAWRRERWRSSGSEPAS